MSQILKLQHKNNPRNPLIPQNLKLQTLTLKLQIGETQMPRFQIYEIRDKKKS